MSPKKDRIDRLLVERGLFDSRAKAQAAIEAGLVSANDAPVRKASEEIPVDASLRASAAHPYVSRGGVKLSHALDQFGFDPRGRICLDVGASTGGFTQVLLERGAKRVYAVDVGHGQLHQSLRARPEVVSLEDTDIRKLSPALLSEPPDLVTVDVSFISLKLVLPAALALAKSPAQLIALIKPQFEAGRARFKERHRARCRRSRRGLRRHCGLRRRARLPRSRRHAIAHRRRRRQCRISVGGCA